MTDTIKRQNTVKERYHRARALQQASMKKTMVINATLFPNWIGDSDCLWYEQETKEGKQYRLVNAHTATNELAFDHIELAQTLSQTTRQEVNSEDLPISQVKIELSPRRVTFTAFGQHWVFDANERTCTEVIINPAHWLVSPDGKKAAFLRNYNLWLRDLDSGEEKALTHDGEHHYAYAILPERWNLTGSLTEMVLSEKPEALWSPDSKKLFTMQTDERQVKPLPVNLYVPKDGSLRPKSACPHVAFPGDDHIAEFRLLTIEVETGQVCEANYPRILDTCAWPYPFKQKRAWWSKDSYHAYFVDVERGEQLARVVEFDTQTGTTRILFEETSETYIDLSAFLDDSASLLPLPESNELIWFSERSGWAHLYLYDLKTGTLKNPITEGDWLVRETLHFNAESREVFIQAAGRVVDRDPYYREVCRVNVDTGEITTLASSDHDYVVYKQGSHALFALGFLGRDVDGVTGLSPSGNYFVTTRSRADEAPVTELRDHKGKVVMEIETADISGLPEGWQWPEPVKLTAADGETDIYGLVFRPSDFSPDKKYPVINYMHGNPYMSCVPKGSFDNDSLYGFLYLPAAAYAELGFITVLIDGRGTPFRSKAFHDESYGRVHTASNLEDHIAGIRQLAEHYPYIDLNRIGITNGPGGCNAPVHALLEYPDFYKVGTACSTYDIRLSPATWGERWQGIPQDNNYEQSVSGNMATNLKGKLLLIHGMLDHFFHPAGVFQLVEALIRENKDFDLLLMPNAGHCCWDDYALRRAWDYFVRHLQGSEPPAQFKL